MANSFIDTSVLGDFTVTGSVTDGDYVDSIVDRITNNYNKLTDMFCDDYGLEVTTANGSGWTVDSATAYLVGNILRVDFKATRSTAPAGNINAELMGKVIINDEGKINQALASSICNSFTGNIMTGYANATNDTTTTTINFYFSGTRSANTGKQFATYVHLPVTLNPDYF